MDVAAREMARVVAIAMTVGATLPLHLDTDLSALFLYHFFKYACGVNPPNSSIFVICFVCQCIDWCWWRCAFTEDNTARGAECDHEFIDKEVPNENDGEFVKKWGNVKQN